MGEQERALSRQHIRSFAMNHSTFIASLITCNLYLHCSLFITNKPNWLQAPGLPLLRSRDLHSLHFLKMSRQLQRICAIDRWQSVWHPKSNLHDIQKRDAVRRRTPRSLAFPRSALPFRRSNSSFDREPPARNFGRPVRPNFVTWHPVRLASSFPLPTTTDRPVSFRPIQLDRV